MSTKKVDRPFMQYGNRLTSKQLAVKFESMAKKFDKVQKQLNKQGLTTTVDMSEPDIEKNHCGTIACHGGWAAVVLGSEEALSLHYTEGANLLANYLGFRSRIRLKAWARHYPEFWGNEHGGRMFTCETAFGKDYNETVTMDDIVLHYLEVAARLRNYKD